MLLSCSIITCLPWCVRVRVRVRVHMIRRARAYDPARAVTPARSARSNAGIDYFNEQLLKCSPAFSPRRTRSPRRRRCAAAAAAAAEAETYIAAVARWRVRGEGGR